ncbi:hypothetical protein [Bacillus sp. 165]|uniref:hypothetical protein n=1 Tax=Bacillus sp. 165 TaxID=1529117 RepID=UPI001ADB47A3|nr:hypothetical protein [Bacillus sp. 165]MBO9129253.1 hypothetical protein [Bacillus sp. 165]
MRKVVSFACLLSFLPFLLSFTPKNYLAEYQSPEGIRFVSDSQTWTEEALEELYQELLRNEHGKELQTLREVRIKGAANNGINGEYNPLSHVITLYNGDERSTVESMRSVLSHEYGHHFAFYYIPQHILPIQTKWKTLRHAEDALSLSFWNYSTKGKYKWFTQEIFADDYVMLYGATAKVEKEAIENETVFQHMTKHENKDISNVLENKALQQYLEEVTGLKVDSNRIMQTPQLLDWNDDIVTFKVMQRNDILYRFAFDYYEGEPVPDNWVHRGYYTLLSDNHDTISIPLTATMLEEQTDLVNKSVQISVEAVDVDTNLGMKTLVSTIEYSASK